MKAKLIFFSVMLTLCLAMVPKYGVAQSTQKRVELHFLSGNSSMRGMVIDSKNSITATIFVTRNTGNKGSVALNDKHYVSGTDVSVTIKGDVSFEELQQIFRNMESAGFMINQELIKTQIYEDEKKNP